MGAISRWADSIFSNFLRYLKDDVLITLGAGVVDVALPFDHGKTASYRCSGVVVGLGGSDAQVQRGRQTSIYMTLAARSRGAGHEHRASASCRMMAIFGVAMWPQVERGSTAPASRIGRHLVGGPDIPLPRHARYSRDRPIHERRARRRQHIGNASRRW